MALEAPRADFGGARMVVDLRAEGLLQPRAGRRKAHSRFTGVDVHPQGRVGKVDPGIGGDFGQPERIRGSGDENRGAVLHHGLHPLQG